MQKVIDKLTEKNIKGIAVIGENDTGKTRFLKKLAEILEVGFDGNTYTVSNLLFLSKNINVGKISFLSQSNFLEGTGQEKNDYFKEPLNLDTKNSLLNDVSLDVIIGSELIENFTEYNSIFIELFDIELSKDGNIIRVIEKNEKEYPLDSSGYISIIRTTILLYNLLNNNIKYILIDEGDADLDYEKKSNFIKSLEEIKKLKNSEAKIIFITHSPETIYLLPENYMILSLPKMEIKYLSQDFFSKEEIERKLFNKKERDLYIGENMKTLIELYQEILITSDNEIKYKLNNYNYKEWI